MSTHLARVGVVCVISLAVALSTGLQGCAFRATTAFPGAYFNRNTNAAWLGVEWVNEPRQSDEIAALAQDLARRQIRVVYVFTSYWKSEAGFNSSYAYAAAFIRALKAGTPQTAAPLNVQAWLGLPLAPWGGVDLADAKVRERIVSFATELVREHGFDGVHLDPEPIMDGDPTVLALLDEMRAALGPDPTPSVATRRIWPFSCSMPPLAGRFFWSSRYYKEVAARVDEIALMTYDSALPLPQLYRLWGRLEAIAITRALDGIDVALFVGIPTSEEKTWTHWPNAENMASGLLGLIDGLNDAGANPEALTGVAIYPYWETDAVEWATYDSLWLGQ